MACFSCLALHGPSVSKADLKRSFNSASDPNHANRVLFALCMIKIFGEGEGVMTPSKPSPPYEQLLPLPTPCSEIFLERSLNDPHPHHPTSSIFHCYPLPIHHPSPPPPPLKILIIHFLSSDLNVLNDLRVTETFYRLKSLYLSLTRS